MTDIEPTAWRDRPAWSRTRLEEAGFEGWASFRKLPALLPTIDRVGGVYVVVRAVSSPGFLGASPAGRFKDRDPSVSEDVLRANWVEDAAVVYIGKADDLRRRLREFLRFGSGEPVGHWGGRLIWQLADSGSLLVAWRVTAGQVPREVEAAMIDAFRDAWGKPPFANEPHRLGL